MKFKSKRKNINPIVLVILDGWGLAPKRKSNAIYLADTPNFDKFWGENPHCKIEASGKSVGLIPGQVGNSEAGHMNIGAGRIVKQDILRIHGSIDDGSFFNNPALEHAYQHAQKYKSNIHLMGLISGLHSGHSHPKHLKALLEFFRRRGVKNKYLHLFTDGRDTAPHHGYKFIKDLQDNLQSGEKIVSLIGRLYLDRKKDWSKTERIYHALIYDKVQAYEKPADYIKQMYDDGLTDEFIPPANLANRNGQAIGLIRDRDVLIFSNLRSDRARQLTKPFVQVNFESQNSGAFKRKKILKDLAFVAMTDFGPDLGNILTAFPSPDVKDTLPTALQGKKQLYLAESEKFAQITYFFNGGYADPIAQEGRLQVDSPIVANYAEKPEMAAGELAKLLVKHLSMNKYDFLAVNFANADMVGHTGDMRAAIKACETVDICLGEIYEQIKKQQGIMIITADHGNAEELYDSKTHRVNTSHDVNPVPFIIISESVKIKRMKLKKNGVLGDIAPTILDLFDLPQPKAMTRKSLINSKF